VTFWLNFDFFLIRKKIISTMKRIFHEEKMDLDPPYLIEKININICNIDYIDICSINYCMYSRIRKDCF
jgi:hypothetical protein